MRKTPLFSDAKRAHQDGKIIIVRVLGGSVHRITGFTSTQDDDGRIYLALSSDGARIESKFCKEFYICETVREAQGALCP